MRLNLLRFKTKSYLKHNKAIRQSMPYDQARNFGIVFTAKDRERHEEIKEFVKILEHDGKQVRVVSFLPKDTQNHEFLFDFFTEKEMTFWGQLTSDTANRFADTPFDFLICLDEQANPFLLNLIAKSKARCRVGKYWPRYVDFFELMVESNQDMKQLSKGVYQYLRKLK